MWYSCKNVERWSNFSVRLYEWMNLWMKYINDARYYYLPLNVVWPVSYITATGKINTNGENRIGKWGTSFVSGLESWKLGRGKHWKWSVKSEQASREDRKVEGQAFKNDEQNENVTLLEYNYQNFPSRLKVI